MLRISAYITRQSKFWLITLCFLAWSSIGWCQQGMSHTNQQSASQQRSTYNQSDNQRSNTGSQYDDSAPRKKEKKPKHPYPVLNGLTVGVDLFDPAAMLLGQSYGSYEGFVEVDFKNRFFPIWEFGIGRADNTPEEMNFTYVGKPSLYNRIGLNYNLSYGSKSPHFFYVGARYGFSAFTYDITDISINPSYWEEQYRGNILDQKSTAQWAELVAGIKVKIFNNLFMGWSFRYKLIISSEKTPQSNPWYIPGYGSKTSPVGFRYTISYKIPIKSKLKIKQEASRQAVTKSK